MFLGRRLNTGDVKAGGGILEMKALVVDKARAGQKDKVDMRISACLSACSCLNCESERGVYSSTHTVTHRLQHPTPNKRGFLNCAI